jgi:DNA-binding response OmpR family regulator
MRDMKKILVIEDNDDIRSNTAEILELSEYRVIQAANGKEGVEMAVVQVPDLIICDIMMPVLDGYGVMHAIRKHDSLRNTPFIFLTARTERSDIRKGMELGADDYITKPFSGTELLNAVDGRLKKIELLVKHTKAGIAQDESGPGQQTVQQALQAFVSDRNTNLYRKRDRVYAEGNHPDSLYYVLNGRVRTFKISSEGKELVTGLYGTGDFVGYGELLSNTVYRNTADALDDSELAIIPKADFEELISSDAAVFRKFACMLAAAVAENENRLLGLAYNSLRKKVAVALLMIADKSGKSVSPSKGIEVTRDQLAAIAGTATESLIRTLGDFKAEKMINMNDGVLLITDRKKLEQLSA